MTVNLADHFQDQQTVEGACGGIGFHTALLHHAGQGAEYAIAIVQQAQYVQGVVIQLADLIEVQGRALLRVTLDLMFQQRHYFQLHGAQFLFQVFDPCARDTGVAQLPARGIEHEHARRDRRQQAVAGKQQQPRGIPLDLDQQVALGKLQEDRHHQRAAQAHNQAAREACGVLLGKQHLIVIHQAAENSGHQHNRG